MDDFPEETLQFSGLHTFQCLLSTWDQKDFYLLLFIKVLQSSQGACAHLLSLQLLFLSLNTVQHFANVSGELKVKKEKGTLRYFFQDCVLLFTGFNWPDIFTVTDRDREEKPVYKVVHLIVFMAVSLLGSTQPSRHSLQGACTGGM